MGVSPETSENLVKSGGERLRQKVNTILYGVTSETKGWPERVFSTGRPLRIAYVGRFEEHQKRVSDIPKILACLRNLGGLFDMTLVGEGPEYPQLRRQFEALGIPANYLGSLPPQSVMRVWEEHDVMLLTSSFEGGPLVLLEAMASGCVPVVSRCSGGLIPIVVKEGSNALSFGVGDIEGAAAHLHRLHKDPELLKSLSLAAFETSGAYTVENMLRQYAALFHQVTAEKRGSWSARNYLSLAGRQAKTLFAQA